jgi:tetratricopeptide (TPR) repeat protein
MADAGHVSADAMRLYLTQQAPDADAQRILAHLIHGCRQCAELARSLLLEGVGGWYPAPGEPASHEMLDDLFERVSAKGAEESRRLALEKLEGWAQWAGLEPLPPEERALRVLNSPELLTWGLHQRLIEASRWYTRQDPHEAVDIVKLAIMVGDLIDPARLGGEEARQDLLAESYALLGDAQRLASEFENSRASFNEAWHHEEMGTGSPYTAAYVGRLEAYWMIDLGEFETAEAALEDALAKYRSVGDVGEEGRILVKMGIAAGYAGEAARGVDHIRQALPRIDAKREPRVWMCAQHDLAWFLADVGEAKEALRVLEDARRLYRHFTDDHTQLRLHWLEAKIARGLGKEDEAATILRQLWDEFRARDLRHDLLMVTLDLADAMVASGQVDEAAALVRQFFPLMTAWNMHRYALAAWLMLREALELRRISNLIPRLRLYYRRHWNRVAEFTAE